MPYYTYCSNDRWKKEHDCVQFVQVPEFELDGTTACWILSSYLVELRKIHNLFNALSFLRNEYFVAFQIENELTFPGLKLSSIMSFGVRFKLVWFHFTIRRFSLLNLMAFAWTKIVFALVITYQSHVATFSFRIPSSLSREARLKALKAPEETVFSFYSWKDSNLLMINRWSFRVRIIKFCFARQTASLRCSCVSQKTSIYNGISI